MQKRTIKVAILAALAVILVLSFSSIALAGSTWSDLPDTVTAKYGITDNQVASISDGFAGGLWKPYQAVTRAQFTKMAVAAFKVNLANPATASFTDVPKSNYYYQYIEGAKAAGLVNGITATTFSPNANITRQQAIAIVSRYIADVQGYDLATMYTAAEIDHILAHFGDAASISASLKAEVAFAFDFGITQGDAYGNLAPLANLTRIQGAAFLIRAEAKVPPAQWTAKDIELVTADKSENLIGQAKEVTFKVTDGNGHPAAGVLVDFDTLYANPLYVGNVSPEAGVTDSKGEVKVSLISHEPGTEKVSATIMTVDGVTKQLVYTAYWVALDEVYITDATRQAENNAGEAHTWGARVIVMGPGPRSTSEYDWYNWISTAPFDPTNVKANDGIDGPDDSASYADEVAEAALGYAPRTLAGISVEWSIVNVVNDNPNTTTVDETIPSVGKITKVDGVAITPATSAVGTTDAAGYSSITIYSEQTGSCTVQAVADYAGNPYPKLLFNHDTFDSGWDHFTDWDEQPAPYATATKTWIPHVIGGDSDAPITPAYAVNNTGEVETFTLTLKDTFGNVIPGYTVEWWIQGVGFFKTDGTTWVGTGEQNKDVDVTDPKGQATVDLKSLVPGQTILHCKVMDKYGLPYKEWNVVKQWYSIDKVQLGTISPTGAWSSTATNVVNTPHTWTAMVSGAKYVYTIYDLNGNGLRDDQVLIGNRADMKAAAGNYANFDGTLGPAKAADVDPAVGIPFKPAGGDTWYVRFADMNMAANEYWVDSIGTIREAADGIREVWAGLAGKNVYFYTNIGSGGAPTSNTPIATIVNGESLPMYVGTITSATTAKTDANGKATVTINSTNKGLQYTYVVADYAENPQDGDPLHPYVGNPAVPGWGWHELRWASATKTWLPAAADVTKTTIFAMGSAGPIVGDRWTNPILPFTGYAGAATVTVAAPPAGVAAAGVQATVAGGVVTGFTGLPAGTGYTAADVGVAVTASLPQGSGATATATLGTVPPTNNQVGLITVTAGGTGYTVAPTVVIGAPNIPGGTQATAIANINGGSVVSITITNPGSGYTSAPAVTFISNNATVTVGTIAAISGNQVAAITPSAATGLTNGTYAVTVPAPVKTGATFTATVVNGVITGFAPATSGAGYITAPAVQITGSGSGAVAHAVVNADSSLSLVLDFGGSGYAGVNTAPSANPNRDTIAVQVFDTYGNALEGYKVTFEIVGQGTTTAGTEPTYHPYAHFESPDFIAAGVGDLNPHLDANPIWNSATGDDDYAWGTTRDHQINFTTSLQSAAHVDLVMDELPSALANKAHITNIVNIQVFDPNGVRIMEKEVTKEWSNAQPVLTYLNLAVAPTSTGPWTTALTTNVNTPFARVQLLDQYGDPIANPGNIKIKVAGPYNDALPNLAVSGSIDASGYVYVTLPSNWTAGLHTLTAYQDNGSIANQLDANDSPQSAAATITVQ